MEKAGMLTIAYRSADTPLGTVWLGATPKGIFHLSVTGVDVGALEGLFAGRRDIGFRQGGALVDKAARELARYFDGRERKFSVPVDLTGWSPFARRVWRAAARIPFGQTRSYAWVAERVGGANFARAVGGALGANPLPIVIPCHRVVGADGALGGYTGGLWVKRWLLEFESGSQRLPLVEG
ncbi:MAG: methylated-DNA--[protein]-cysteine S-methyltransferase [bacterium]